MAEPSDATSSHRALLLRVVGSVGGGALLVLSFPPYDIVWLAPPALAVMTLSWHGVRARRGFWLGFLAGLAFLLWHLAWMRVIGDDAWVLLAGSFALFVGLVGAGVAATSRLRGWPLAVPLMWVLSEAIRDRAPLGGFPWGRLAYGQTSTTLTPYAALAGAPAVTFAISLVGALLAYAWIERRRPRATGNVPGAGMGAFDERAVVLQNHVRETERLAADVKAGRAPKPDVVVWPENSTDIDPFVDASAHEQIQQAVDAIDVPVLVGAVVNAPTDPDHVWNVGIVWLPSSAAQPGPGDYYVKQHPVPFGEWIPGRAVLSRLISRFDRIPRDFASGGRTGVLQLGPARLGDLICFEVAYDELGRAAVRGEGVTGDLAGLGARILTVQTNNATYGRTGQPEQQMAMSRLRAVEHGRAVLIAATSGISAIIRPDGTVSGSLPEFTAGYLVEKVPLRDSLTVSDRVGALPEHVAGLAAIALLAVAAFGRRRTRVVGSQNTQPIEESVP